MSMPECICPIAGWCKRYSRDLTSAEHDVCNRTIGSDTFRDALLAGLATAPIRDPSKAIAAPSPTKLAAGVPIESRVVKRTCGGCGGTKAASTETRTTVENVRNRNKKSFVARGAKLLEAMARHLADDNAETPPDVVAFRESQCAACPLNTDGRCDGCGCLLHSNLLNKGKLRWRSEACPAGKWSRHYDHRRPLVNPTRNLIFHLYPLKSAEWNWRWHIDQIVKHASLFNGRIAIGIGTGSKLSPADEVMNLLRDVPVTDWVVRPNTKQLAETATFVDLLRCVKTDDPNSVTFRYHTKGVTHKKGSVEQRWAELLWETNMDLPSVDDALASHVFAGSMLSREPLVRRKTGNFFYAGSAYWFRSDVFARDWATIEQNRWWVEYWPGAVASEKEAACLCHDFTEGSVLSEDYFKSQVQPDWDLWKTARMSPVDLTE